MPLGCINIYSRPRRALKKRASCRHSLESSVREYTPSPTYADWFMCFWTFLRNLINDGNKLPQYVELGSRLSRAGGRGIGVCTSYHLAAGWRRRLISACNADEAVGEAETRAEGGSSLFSATKQIASNCGTPYCWVCVCARVCALGKSAQSARVAATIKKPFGVGAGKYATKCERASSGAPCRSPACSQCQVERTRTKERVEGESEVRFSHFESHLAAKWAQSEATCSSCKTKRETQIQAEHERERERGAATDSELASCYTAVTHSSREYSQKKIYSALKNSNHLKICNVAQQQLCYCCCGTCSCCCCCCRYCCQRVTLHLFFGRLSWKHS